MGIFKYGSGKNGEGWWDSKKMLKQVSVLSPHLKRHVSGISGYFPSITLVDMHAKLMHWLQAG